MYTCCVRDPSSSFDSFNFIFCPTRPFPIFATNLTLLSDSCFLIFDQYWQPNTRHSHALSLSLSLSMYIYTHARALPSAFISLYVSLLYSLEPKKKGVTTDFRTTRRLFRLHNNVISRNPFEGRIELVVSCESAWQMKALEYITHHLSFKNID